MGPNQCIKKGIAFLGIIFISFFMVSCNGGGSESSCQMPDELLEGAPRSLEEGEKSFIELVEEIADNTKDFSPHEGLNPNKLGMFLESGSIEYEPNESEYIIRTNSKTSFKDRKFSFRARVEEYNSESSGVGIGLLSLFGVALEETESVLEARMVQQELDISNIRLEYIPSPRAYTAAVGKKAPYANQLVHGVYTAMVDYKFQLFRENECVTEYNGGFEAALKKVSVDVGFGESKENVFWEDAHYYLRSEKPVVIGYLVSEIPVIDQTPTGLRARLEEGEPATVRLDWNPVEAAHKYYVYWSNSPDINIYDPSSYSEKILSNSNEYIFVSGVPGETYYFTVTSVFGRRESERESTASLVMRKTLDQRSPIAEGGERSEAYPGDVVTLDGSGSFDPEGEELTYRWLQITGPPVEMDQMNTSMPSFVVPDIGERGGDLTFQLTVMNGLRLEDADYCIVTVLPSGAGGGGSGELVRWYKDADRDQHSDGSSVESSERPSNYYSANELISITGDCDDNNPMVFPGAEDFPNDGIDQDCDGQYAGFLETWYKDSDGDGYSSGEWIAQPNRPGEVYYLENELNATGGDCDDFNPTVYTGAEETPNDGLDQDCDGEDLVSEGVWHKDSDGDGFPANVIMFQPNRPPGGNFFAPAELEDLSIDCDDSNPFIFPGARVIPDDGIDQDCDGVDEISEKPETPEPKPHQPPEPPPEPPSPFKSWYKDADGDGYSDGTILEDISAPNLEYYLAGDLTSTSGDCDDNDFNIHPGAEDIPNDGVDQDCEGGDEVSDRVWYRDFDGDGYSSGETLIGPNRPSNEFFLESELIYWKDDCKDDDASINPEAVDIPNDGIDQDCNGADSVSDDPETPKEPVPPPPPIILYKNWYKDFDGDGYSDGTNLEGTTDPGPEYYLADELISTNGDCIDDDFWVHPGAEDIPDDGIDQDCDGADATSSGPIYVPDDFATIQSAIDAASSGDEIWVRDGFYPGGLRVSAKNLTIRSENGPNSSVIECQTEGNGISFQNVSEATIDGFTIQNCNNTDGNSGGIHSWYSNVQIKNCVVKENYAGRSGGGIAATDSSLKITNSLIKNNSAQKFGGGIDLSFGEALIENTTISENSAGESGGGVKAFNMSSLRMENGIVSSNISGSGTAAISLTSHTDDFFSEIVNCLIHGNTLDDPGGLYPASVSFDQGDHTILNSTFFNNNLFPLMRVWGDTRVTIQNSIIWSDANENTISNNSSNLSVQYSNIRGGFSGVGNQENAPLFWGESDFRLLPGSPCIDAGTQVDAPSNDIEGIPRPMGAGYDIGAYEYIP